MTQSKITTAAARRRTPVLAITMGDAATHTGVPVHTIIDAVMRKLR